MQEYFGIDFGTTNSAVVGHLHRNITFYGDERGDPFPSLIAISNATGEVQEIGREAWNRREELSESCKILHSAKMKLGSGEKIRIGARTWTPQMVVTEVFKGLQESVKIRGSGAQLEKPVMAIPVGFSHEKRSELRKAAEAAEIEISGFVSEPTAAVFKNYENVKHWPYVIVFDWGGGTLDISLVSIQKDMVKEIATISKTLGGDDLDYLLAEWTHKQILFDKRKNDPPFSGMESYYRDLLVLKCEEAKCMMTTEDIWEFLIPKYGSFGTVNPIITNDEFERLMNPIIEESIAALEECVITRARLSFDQIGCIIMVGGTSNLRGLRDAIENVKWSSDIVIIHPEDSDWHVADGAAVLASDSGEYICAQNLGILLSDNTIFPLVTDGEKINSNNNSITFGLTEDTDNARIVFVESKDSDKERISTMARTLGYLSVPVYGFSNEPIKLKSQIDQDLLFRVSIRSECRGKIHEKEWIYPELKFNYKLPL